MTTKWRRIGWQQMQAVVPADWYLVKASIERASGDLQLNDDEMPRLQIKWLDSSKEKSVNPTTTLDRYVQQLERQAKKTAKGGDGEPFAVERDISLVGRAGRDISSIEAFHWRADMQAYGVIWYSSKAERVTLAQVNGKPEEKGLKALAKDVLTSLKDVVDGDEDLWTAYDLECTIPRKHELLSLNMATGHAELKFGQAKDTLTVSRYGLAEIVLKRAGDLGDWAFGMRDKDWSTFRLDREPGEWAGQPAVTFRGPKRALVERIRQRTYNFLRLPYPVMLSARVWHCAEANCIYLVEQFRDARSEDLLDKVCESIPCAPNLFDSPKG